MVLVDTNILAYLLLVGDRTPAAQALFDRDDDWHSESFILVELNNVLATSCRSLGLTPAKAERIFGTAERLLAGRLHTVPHRTALAVAAKLRISAYDARFVALAEELGVPLITEDARLRGAARAWTRSVSDALG